MNSDDVKNIALIGVGILAVRELSALVSNPQLDSVDEIEVNSEQLTYDLLFYDQQADIIFYALWEYWIFEDEELVIEAMQMMQNNEDVKQLIKAYGVRCWGPFCTKVNLPTSIALYLSPDQINEINSDYTEKGITILF